MIRYSGSIIAIAVGRFTDVIGARNVLVGVSIIGGFVLVSFMCVSSLATYYFAGVLLGIASPGTTSVFAVSMWTCSSTAPTSKTARSA